jgi:anti-anti-sigma factor
MKITTKIENNLAIIDLSGSILGGADAQKFRDEIYNLVEKGIIKVVCDLSQVDRMNSSGLGILISNYTTLIGKGGNLKLANVNKLMRGILVMTKLDTVFDNYDTVEQAIHSF